MKTRRTAAKESASESGYSSRRPHVFEDSPRSPSTIAPGSRRTSADAPAAGTDPAAPTPATAPAPAPSAAASAERAAPTTSHAATAAPTPRTRPEDRVTAPVPVTATASVPVSAPAPAPAYMYRELLVTPSTSREGTSYPALSTPRTRRPMDSAQAARADETSVQDTASTIRSRRSYSSEVARVKKAEYEAQRKIAAIRNEQLEIAKALVSKRFEYEVSTIQAEAEARDIEEEAEERRERSVHDSEGGGEEKVDEWLRSVDRSHPPVVDQLQSEQPPPLTTGRRPPEVATYAEPVTYVDATTPAVNNRRRMRSTSRSPTRGDRRTGRGIEQLAETLEKMIRVRPPPRQVTELPTFTGAATEWLPFKAAFNDSSSLYKFSAIENLARLRNCIKGEAREAVSALLYTASDPQVIMKTLEQYYGRPEILIDRVMEDLKRLPRLTGAASELNTFAVKLQNIVCVLSNMDNRGYIWNPMLVREVVDKLSPHIKSRWCDYASERVESSREPEVVLLSRFLMREADRAMKYAFATTTPVPASKKETKAMPQVGIKKKTNRDAVYTTTEKEDEKKQECLCCGGEHEVPKCSKFLKMNVDERWEWARTAKVCFKCVTRRHRREHCRGKRCGMEKCGRAHHTLLHKEQDVKVAADKVNEGVDDSAPKEAVMTVSAANGKQQRVLLKVCPVTLKGPGGQLSTFALMDEGSTISLIDEDLVRRLRVSGPASTLRIQGVTSQENEESSQTVKLQICGQDGNFEELRARTMKNLRLHGQSVDRTALANYPHLRDLEQRAFFEKATPKLLIGADNWHLIVTRELRVGKKSEPAASFTKLGWVIHGTAPRATLREREGHVVLHLYDAPAEPEVDQEENIRRLEELVKSHFRIDALGVSLAKKVKPEDKQAIDVLQRTMRKVGDHFEVGLPWRDTGSVMPNNYNCALRRLKTIERKMDSSPRFATQYSALVHNLFSKRYAQECDGTEDTSERQWYLPHFPVMNPNKPGKMRMVFDAAHRYKGTYLNDYLLEGPDLLRPLPGILFRFRERPVAVTADIQEMFLQIKVAERDQPAQMFLWRGEERKKPPVKYKMTSMIFGASCSPFIAHTVRNANAELHSREHPDAVRAITSNHYMDDYVDSFATEEEAVKTAYEVMKIHQNAHFNLRGWCPNARVVMRSITKKRQACDVEVKLGQSNLQGKCPNARNVMRNITMERQACDVEVKLGQREESADKDSHFNLWGWCSNARDVMRNITQEKQTCDVEVKLEQREDARTFEEWLRDLVYVTKVRIVRCYGRGPDDVMDLHVFCNASEQAYAANACWRIESPEEKVRVKMAAARTRVTSRRAVTVSSLSTDSALMAIRRMAARRGWPQVMYSDNGTNFRGADAELRAAYKEWAKEFPDFGLHQRMRWKFIPPGAPHMGGAWERLVRSVKAALGATLHQKALKEEVLLTLLTEAEHSVNSRPLTHVSVDPKDPEALTPNHFLIGTSSGLPCTGPCEEISRKQWRSTQALADHFWRRWVNEYLPTLVPRGASDNHRRPLQVGDLVVVVDAALPRGTWPRGVVVPRGASDNHRRPLQVGDLVVVVDAALPRGTWPRGVVEAVYSGPDNKVRSADVRTSAGAFRRPVTKLAVLSVED